MPVNLYVEDKNQYELNCLQILLLLFFFLAPKVRPRVSRGGAVAAGEVGRRARSALRPTPRAAEPRLTAGCGREGGRWQEGGD